MNEEIYTLNDFKTQYTGEWNPSEGKYFGLDFKYEDIIYRFNTGSMYNEKNTVLPDGKEAIFGIYKFDDDKFELLKEFADIDDSLKYTFPNGETFKDIIETNNIELLGQD